MRESNEYRDSDSRRAEGPDYIAARRERGKLAQRAFRQRQIDTIRSLEEENHRLRRAISAISDAADRNDTALSQAINNARKLVGIATPEAKRKLPPAPATLDLNGSSRPSATPIETTPVAAPAPPPPPENNTHYDLLIDSYEFDEQANDLSQSFSMGTSDAYDLMANLNSFNGSSDMSMASLSYPGGQMIPTEIPSATFEPDRAIHVADPPPDIVPYMGNGAYTLAGQIYWAALAFGFQALRAIVSSATPPPVAVNVVIHQWSLTSMRLSLPQIMRVMHARLTFRRYGYFHFANDQYAEELKSYLDPILVERLSAALRKDVKKIGFNKSDFLTPLDFEKELRERFRDEYPVFEAALKGQAFDKEHVTCMRKLIQLMSRQAICFGDGPRWRPESVDTLVHGWTMSTKKEFAVH